MAGVRGDDETRVCPSVFSPANVSVPLPRAPISALGMAETEAHDQGQITDRGRPDSHPDRLISQVLELRRVVDTGASPNAGFSHAP